MMGNQTQILRVERSFRNRLHLPGANNIKIGDAKAVRRDCANLTRILLLEFDGFEEISNKKLEKLASLSQSLKKTIFPEPGSFDKVNTFLQDHSDIVVIQSPKEDLTIPWEILGLGQNDRKLKDAWGYDRIFCRQAIGCTASRNTDNRSLDSVGLLGVKAIPQSDETDNLLRGFAKFKYELPKPYKADFKNKDFPKLARYIEKQDITHVACLLISLKHIESPVLLIDDMFVIGVEDLMKINLSDKNPLIVFIPMNNGRFSPSHYVDFASEFVERGSRGVVTNILPISDSVTPAFAESFYENLTSEKYNSVCSALLETKRRIAKDTNNPISLCYTLYEPTPHSPVKTNLRKKKLSITWLHVSDLHFRKQNYDSEVVLDDLIEDVRKQIQNKKVSKPNFIVVTGDIAFSGIQEEYLKAQEFFDNLLEATGLSKDDIIIVPGNHDVCWHKIDKVIGNGYVTSLKSIEDVDNALGSSKDIKRISEKFEYYTGFIKKYFVDKENNPLYPLKDDTLFFVKKLKFSDKQISVLGLNSAWMSAYRWKDGKEFKQADDRHNLILGRRQLKEALDQSKNADIVIAAMHHPTEWFKDEIDRQGVEGLLDRKCHFVLRGHLHSSKIVNSNSPGGETFTITAGASYQRRGDAVDYNGYNFVTLDLSAGVGNIHLRCYSKKHGGFWTADVHSYPDMEEGIYAFSLPDAILE